MKKNRYSGSSFDDFLKEEGIFEEVKILAEKRLADLRANNTDELLEESSELPEESPGHIARFFHWLQQAINRLVS